MIGATGVFNQPRQPDIARHPDSFEGETLHTARWDHDISLEGKRVGIIGTGASAVQVIPEIASRSSTSPSFSAHRSGASPSRTAPLEARSRRLVAKLPGGLEVNRLASQIFVEVTFPTALHFHRFIPISGLGERVARKFLSEEVEGPGGPQEAHAGLRARLQAPRLPQLAISAPSTATNVLLETEPIDSRSPQTRSAPRTAHEHELDVLIYATGFMAFEEGNMPPYPVRGAGGVDLASWWDENRFQAYQGVSVPGFPNIFTILGPYGYNGSSYFNLIENQAKHILRCIDRAQAGRSDEGSRSPRRRTSATSSRCSRAARGRSSSSPHAQPPTRITSTSTATARSARRPPSRSTGEHGHFDLDDYSFAKPEAA